MVLLLLNDCILTGDGAGAGHNKHNHTENNSGSLSSGEDLFWTLFEICEPTNGIMMVFNLRIVSKVGIGSSLNDSN